MLLVVVCLVEKILHSSELGTNCFGGLACCHCRKNKLVSIGLLINVCIYVIYTKYIRDNKKLSSFLAESSRKTTMPKYFKHSLSYQ